MQCNYTVVFLVKVKMLLSAVKFGNFGLVGTIEKKKKSRAKIGLLECSTTYGSRWHLSAMSVQGFFALFSKPDKRRVILSPFW